MDQENLLEIIRGGEDSYTDFKPQAIDDTNLAKTICSFLNFKGGRIVFGIDDKTKKLLGLSDEEASKINQQVTEVSCNNNYPASTITTENVFLQGKHLVLVEIEGNSPNKPYSSNDGIFWLRHGLSFRKMSREQLQRLFLSQHGKSVDELAVCDIDLERLNMLELKSYLSKYYSHHSFKTNNELITTLEKIGLAEGNKLLLAGLLLFDNNPAEIRSDLMIKATASNDAEKSSSNFIDLMDISGCMSEVLETTLTFIKRNTSNIKNGGFNSPTVAEMNPEALEEIIVNALIHRDYGIRSPINLFIFKDRLELSSPGCLSNHLTTEKIKNGINITRNNILTSHAARILPYRGRGTGIPRLIKHHPDAELINDEKMQQFIVKIPRKSFQRLNR